MSWLYSQALVAEYSQVNCSDGEPSAQWNVMLTPQGFWRNDKMMEYSSLSRFGVTCKLLTESHGQALLTSYLEGFHVWTSVSPAKGKASMGLAADCGRNLRGSLAKYDPDTHSLKTAQLCFFEDSTSSSVTLPRSGTMRNGCVYQRPNVELTTSETEFGYLPTASEGGRNKSASPGAQIRPSLGMMAAKNLWPTPTVNGNHNRKGLSKRSGDGLSTAVKTWPTPKAAEASRGDSKSERRRKTPCLTAQLNIEANTVRGQLNPVWEEWLMGWPGDWSALDASEMDKYHEWWQQHSMCYFQELQKVKT